MFYFDINIYNPLMKSVQWDYDSLVQKEKSISYNKTLEYSYGNPQKNRLFGFSIDLRFSGNHHAGPEVEFCLLGWEFSVSIRDNRHWNYEYNRWCTHGEF